MRMLLKVQVPVGKGNQALKDGTLQQTFESTLERLKPEAAYFTLMDGKRTALIVFDLAEQSQLPSIGEPLFTNLEAGIDLTPVMTAEDLQKGLQAALG